MLRPTASRLVQLVDAMQGQPVHVVADLVADRFVTGAPKRISREAPVLILELLEERLVPGGGANAVANMAALGGRPFPVGWVGGDESGRLLVAALADLGVDTRGIRTRDGYRTPTKTRILGGGLHAIKQQIVRYDREDRLELGARDVETLARTLGGAPPARIGVVSDYGYGAAAPAALPALRRVLGPSGLILGDSRYRMDQHRGLDGATPNEEETEVLLGGPLGPSPTPSLQALRQQLGMQFLLVTRGSCGMTLLTGEGAAQLPVHGTDQVADVTGAGDTVIGTFALALAAEATPLEAAALANYAGGVVVMKAGTATLTPDELARAVESDPRPLEELSWDG